jgi:hypothetical protein
VRLCRAVFVVGGNGTFNDGLYIGLGLASEESCADEWKNY